MQKQFNRVATKSFLLLLVITFRLFFVLFFRIGLCGFDNPMRDQKTQEYKRHIGHVSTGIDHCKKYGSLFPKVRNKTFPIACPVTIYYFRSK